MKTLIIYVSVHHQNTEKVGAAMAETLGAELVPVGGSEPLDLQPYDLIGFGSGIFFGKHHAKLLELIEQAELKGKAVFVFSTSGTGSRNYNQPLIKLLSTKGAKVKADFSCKGYDTYGPFKWIGGIAKGRPGANDLKAAQDFAAKLILK